MGIFDGMFFSQQQYFTTLHHFQSQDDDDKFIFDMSPTCGWLMWVTMWLYIQGKNLVKCQNPAFPLPICEKLDLSLQGGNLIHPTKICVYTTNCTIAPLPLHTGSRTLSASVVTWLFSAILVNSTDLYNSPHYPSKASVPLCCWACSTK